MLSYYASADPQEVWQARAATALFIAAFGAAGYLSRRDLSALARTLLWAFIGLIVFGIVTIFVQIRSPTARSLGWQFRRLDSLRLPAPSPQLRHPDGSVARPRSSSTSSTYSCPPVTLRQHGRDDAAQSAA
jgi:Inhibitor of apoptosis-promoting Bax1